MRPHLLCLAALFLFGGVASAAAPPVEGAPVLKDTILSQIPHDASFFASSLRNKEQLDALRNSRAYRTLRKSPVYKIVLDAVKQLMEDQGLPADLIDRLFDDKPPKKDDKDEPKHYLEELIDLLLGSLGDEVFVYGGRGWADLANLLREATSAGVGGAGNEVGNGDVFAALKALGNGSLGVLQKERETLRVPELVIGMKTKDVKAISQLVKRLEKELTPLLAFDARLKGRLKRDGDLLTLQLDGSLIPWSELDLGDLADKKDFADLFAHLKQMPLAISFGVRGDYVVLAIGSSPKDLGRLGKGKPLARRNELQPIAKQDAKKVTAVAYVSADFLNATLGTPDWAAAAKTLTSLIDKSVEKAETKKSLKKEVDGLAAWLTKRTRRFGAVSGYAVRTAGGYEGYWHDFGDCSRLKGVTTHLFDHVRGDPLFAAAFGVDDPLASYAALAKHVRALYGHAEEAFLAWEIDEEHKAEYKKHSPAFLKAMKKLDDVIAKQLTPAMKGRSGAGLVVDGKWTSARWQTTLPETKRKLPLFEPALLLGVGDRAKFADGMKAAIAASFDVYAAVREALATTWPLPEVKIPEATKTATKQADFYAWPDALKRAGLDEQVRPTAGVSDRVAALALSKGHAEGLVTPTKLAAKDGPLLTHKRELIAGMLLDVPALVELVLAWTDAAPDLVPGDLKKQAGQIAKQVREAGTVLKCVRGVQSATYLDGVALTTHWRVVLQDLDESPEPAKKK